MDKQDDIREFNIETTKIKLFDYEIFNCTSFATSHEKEYEWYKDTHDKLSTQEEIQLEINKFLIGKKFVNLKINHYTICDNNKLEGRANRVTYTLIYTE